MHVKECYARDSADLLALEARRRVSGGSPVGVTEPDDDDICPPAKAEITDHRHRPMPTESPSRERVQAVFKNVLFFLSTAFSGHKRPFFSLCGNAFGQSLIKVYAHLAAY